MIAMLGIILFEIEAKRICSYADLEVSNFYIGVTLCFHCERCAESMSVSRWRPKSSTLGPFVVAAASGRCVRSLVTALCNFRGGSILFILFEPSSVTLLISFSFVCA